MSVYPCNNVNEDENDDSNFTSKPKSSRLLMNELIPHFVELSCDWHGNHVIQSLIENVRKLNNISLWNEIFALVDRHRFLLSSDQYGKHVVKMFEQSNFE
jgi:hypothetical protein